MLVYSQHKSYMEILYKEQAQKARSKVLEMLYESQMSHAGSNLSCIDLLTVLFAKTDLAKEKIIFSKGWAAAAAYYFLAQKGVIPEADLDTYCKPDSKLIGLVEPGVPGIHFAGGSMSMGIAAGIGFALAKRLHKEQGNIYVLESDGAMDGGITWESALIAAHQKLGNLVVLLDANGLQAMGKNEDVLNLEPLVDKWKSFNWDVTEIDGHDYAQIEKALTGSHSKPHIIIARTTKGKGVSFMENQNLYHYKKLSQDEYEKAQQELNG